jgi:hypothetical protein
LQQQQFRSSQTWLFLSTNNCAANFGNLHSALRSITVRANSIDIFPELLYIFGITNW